MTKESQRWQHYPWPYHPLLGKQILLATMHCKSENNENSETFWSR